MEGEVEKRLLDVGSDGEETLKKRIWTEAKKMWIVAGPSILIRGSIFGITVATQAFAGFLGTTELAACALVFTVISRFANGILAGMTNGLGTLCGQAFGAKQYHKLGIYLQQSWIVLVTTAIILTPIFVFTTPILRALGQEEHIAKMAGTIARWFIPVLYSYVVFFSCQMYLQSQSKHLIVACLAFFSFLLHIFLSWLLTMRYKFGISGAMVSAIIAFWIPCIGEVIYIFSGGCPKTWRGFTALAFKDLGPIIKLSLSSGAMICLELWYNPILLLLTGNMKNAEVTIDALSICLGVSGWCMMISFGFMTGANVRVSNELGRREAKVAKFAIVIIVLTSFALACLLCLFVLLCRERLAYMFTKSDEVATAVGHLSPLLAFSMLLNGVQPVLSGVASGAGWQSWVAFINLASYYLVGIPVGVMLGFLTKLQVQGVWAGMILGTLVQTIILVIITCRTDWDKQVSLAVARVNRWSVDGETNDISTPHHSRDV